VSPPLPLPLADRRPSSERHPPDRVWALVSPFGTGVPQGAKLQLRGFFREEAAAQRVIPKRSLGDCVFHDATLQALRQIMAPRRRPSMWVWGGGWRHLPPPHLRVQTTHKRASWTLSRVSVSWPPPGGLTGRISALPTASVYPHTTPRLLSTMRACGRKVPPDDASI